MSLKVLLPTLVVFVMVAVGCSNPPPAIPTPNLEATVPTAAWVIVPSPTLSPITCTCTDRGKVPTAYRRGGPFILHNVLVDKPLALGLS